MQNDRPADFYDVCARQEGVRSQVFRFEGTEQGFLRAKKYARDYNKSLRDAMGLTEVDLETEISSLDFNRPDQYEKALTIESYRDHSASVRPAYEIPVIKDGDPLPTDYPHDF
jgi:hypothetical protein